MSKSVFITIRVGYAGLCLALRPGPLCRLVKNDETVNSSDMAFRLNIVSGAVVSGKKEPKVTAGPPSGEVYDSDAAAEELRRWMSGEDGLLSWLEADPEVHPTFYSNGHAQTEISALRERLQILEAEIARLEDELASSSARKEEMEAEIARLRSELEAAPAKGGDAPPAANEVELEKRFQAELEQKEMERRQLEADLQKTIQALRDDLARKEIEDRVRQDETCMATISEGDASKELQERLRSMQDKERRILELQDLANRLHDTVQEREDELKGLKEIVSYKEQELTRREEDLAYRERKASEERRRLEDAKQSAAGLEEAELKKRLEELRAEVDKREKELKAKEDYLRAKEADLRRREQGLIEEDLKHMDKEIAMEVQVAKAKTGNPRLDDLLMGGVPFGSNVLVYGPPFVGKETMVCQFIAEGLKKGIPALWVTTDKTPAGLREEMKLVLPSYEEYEALGLVQYVDSYSRSMGDTTEDPYTIYVEEPTAHDHIMAAVEEIAKKFLEGHEYYRLAFRTISTLIAYSDPNTAFRFLNPFCGRRKRDRAVSMYTIEKGMHGEQEIQMLGSIMDGMIDFKIDQLRTFFMVRGITDVQSRSFIRYTATRHGLSIGSFALDHIK